jgi:predicted transcriptional regulator
VLTRIQATTNVPFDRLKGYIVELVDLGMIQDETSLKLTHKGTEYLKEYRNVLEFMKRMGIRYREKI